MVFVRIFVSLLFSVAALYFVGRGVQWQDLREIISQAHYMPFVWAIGISIVTFILRAWRWQILLRPFKKIGIWRLLRWQLGALFINNIAPLRLGEFVRAYWTGHKAQIAKSSVLGTVVMERVLDISSMALIALVVLLSAGIYHVSPIVLVAGGGIAIVVALILAFCFPKNQLEKLAIKFFSIFPQKIGEKLQELFFDFIKGLAAFKDKREILKVVLISPLIWSVDIFLVATISRSVDLNLSWMHAAVLVVGLILGVMVPAAPGAAGTYEAGGVAALSLVGVDKTLALSFILLLHSFQFITTLIAGIPVLLAEGVNLKILVQSQKGEK